MDHLPAIVTPLDDHMGLDIARSLSRRGVTVYGIDADPRAPGKYSRSCYFVLGPNPESETEYLQFLLDFGNKMGCKAVLFPLSDLHVLLISRHRAALSQYFEFVMPHQEMVERLTTKDGLGSVAREFGFSAPETIAIPAKVEIEAIAAKVAFPVILKPIQSTYWHNPKMAGALRDGLFNGRAKVVLCHDREELIQAYRQIAAWDDRLIIQEVIPGEDSCLVYFSFYLDRFSRPLGVFAGRKYRVIPTGFGSASYVRSVYDPKLINLGLRLLSAIQYQGLGGIEFKQDARDDCFKLIEFNTRFGMWDGLSARCGLDLPYIAYCDTLHLPVTPQMNFREGVIWVDWQRDVRAALAYRRMGQLTLRQWLQSLRGEKMWAIYSKDDWKPGAAFTLSLAGKFLDRLIRGGTKS